MKIYQSQKLTSNQVPGELHFASLYESDADACTPSMGPLSYFFLLSSHRRCCHRCRRCRWRPHSYYGSALCCEGVSGAVFPWHATHLQERHARGGRRRGPIGRAGVPWPFRSRQCARLMRQNFVAAAVLGRSILSQATGIAFSRLVDQSPVSVAAYGGAQGV